MRLNIPCPACGTQGCFKHCMHCGTEVMWRPKGLDPGIKYTGPKPLNLDGSHHDRCVYSTMKEKTGDPIIDNISYTKELGAFLRSIKWTYQ